MFNWKSQEPTSVLSTAVSDHFSLPDHSIKDIEVIPLELLNSYRDGIRKAREGFLLPKGKTLEPCGMHRRDHEI